MDINKYCDNSLISKIQKDGNTDAAVEIINRHERIVYSVITKFCKRNPHLNKEELLDDKYAIFQQAIRTYKKNKKAKFSSWLYLQARFYILNTHKNHDKSVSLENKDIDYINTQNNIFQLCGQNIKDNTEYINNLLNQIPDKRIKKIFKMRYFDGRGNKVLDWKTIGQNIGLSITRVISLHEEGRKILFKKINSTEKSDII